jgi:hypothetical protein
LFPETSPVKLFFSYAHEDEGLRVELEKHLSLLKHQGLIDGWHDRRIVAGGDWASEIDKNLDASRVILLLVSANFIHSEYCYSVEFKRALARHEAGHAHIIPVLLSAVDWESAPFGKFQALPANARPVTSWENRNEAFANIAKGIRAAVERMRQGVGKGGAGCPGNELFNVPPLLPYLCDRSDQEGELGEALSLHLRESPRRPFMVVIHGDEYECHSEFLDRLQEESLPSLLDLKRRGLSVEYRMMPWPESVRAGRSAELSKTFRRLVGIEMVGNSAAPPEGVFDDVAPDRPVMLGLPLKTEDLTRGGVETLRAFFDFWDEWPDLPVGRTLVCAVSVRHRRVERMGFFLRRRLRMIDREVRRFIAGAAAGGGGRAPAPPSLDFGRYENLGGVVLPELRAITQQEVLVWSRSKIVRAMCRIRESEIEAIFKRRELCAPGGPIPMQLLADELEELVKRYRL